jgi:hypothetical protein
MCNVLELAIQKHDLGIISLHTLKDVGMTNEAAPEPVRSVICPVIRPLSIRPVVHADIKG